MADILIVEDDKAIASLYCAPVKFAVQPDCRPPARYFLGDTTVNPGGLQYNLYEPESGRVRLHLCPGRHGGADHVEKRRYDLILLDIMLPEVDGYELLEYIKPTGTPVIFLTAKGAVEDRIRGLKAGADDYLTKPFQVGELLARVEAVLRRMGAGRKQLEMGDVSIALDSRQVTKGGCPVVLTAKEFDLLVELVQNKNIALYREQLYEKVWKEPFFGETRTLDAHIQRLRKKLGWEERIKTVFRIGYRLEG